MGRGGCLHWPLRGGWTQTFLLLFPFHPDWGRLCLRVSPSSSCCVPLAQGRPCGHKAGVQDSLLLDLGGQSQDGACAEAAVPLSAARWRSRARLQRARLRPRPPGKGHPGAPGSPRPGRGMGGAGTPRAGWSAGGQGSQALARAAGGWRLQRICEVGVSLGPGQC